MPSAKILEAKKAYVAELNTKIAGSLAGVVVSITASALLMIPRCVRNCVKLALSTWLSKTPCCAVLLLAPSTKLLLSTSKGDTAIALSAEDPAAAARILCKVADADKSKRFTVKGGFCDGQVLDAAGVKGLSTMPNREGLLSMLAGSLNGIIGGLAVAIQGIVDKQEETPAA